MVPAVSSDDGLFVVMTGLPGSGKSTLGRSLAVEMGLPHIDKDDVLETLFDTVGVASPDERSRLSRASDSVMETLARASRGAVLTSFWRRGDLSGTSGTPTDWLRALPAGAVVEVHCDCPPEESARRFTERQRHPGHFDDRKALLDVVGQFEPLAALGPLGIGPLVRVDTNGTVDAAAVARAVRQAADGPVPRPTTRVLLIDDLGRTLLFRSLSEERGDAFWYPPGGGVDAGETHEAAGRRELWEETGLTDPVLGPEIGHRRHVVAWGGVSYDVRERWFLSRVPPFDISTDGFDEAERLDILEHRWWTLAELHAATERLVPEDLADLVAGILRDGPPAQPLTLGR